MRNITSIDSTIGDLERRLHNGDVLIRQMEADGKPVELMVEHWLRLLHEYEQAFRELSEAA